MTRLLRPAYFFIGIITGFIACCIAGMIISHHARFAKFERFFRAISPEMHYYPTSSELLATAKHIVDPHKILVLVGGSSIFRGTGQNIDEVWTRDLQKLLGADYQVLNFAVNGGDLNSFGGTAYRILFEKFPNMIYVATATYGGPPEIDGVSTYNYLFWDAYYKGLFHSDKAELQKIHALRKTQMQDPAGIEKHLLSFLDSYFYFRNLWNWVSYHVKMSVWTESAFKKRPFTARDRYIDETDATLKQQQFNVAHSPARFDAEVDLYKRIIESLADLSPKHPRMLGPRHEVTRRTFENAFSPEYRKKTLCVFIRENPRQLSRLSKKHLAAHELIFTETARLTESLGYHAIDIGKDFRPDDYFDGGHLMASGGKKVAVQVAAKIKQMTATLPLHQSETLR